VVPGVGRRTCAPKTADLRHQRTAGMLFYFCNCGFQFPPMEMISAESCTQVNIYSFRLLIRTVMCANTQLNHWLLCESLFM
jgi:hypothetical protein